MRNVPLFAVRNVFTNTVRYIIQNTPTCTFSGFFYVVVTNDCIQQGSNSPEEKLILLPIFSLNQYIVLHTFIPLDTCNQEGFHYSSYVQYKSIKNVLKSILV